MEVIWSLPNLERHCRSAFCQTKNSVISWSACTCNYSTYTSSSSNWPSDAEKLSRQQILDFGVVAGVWYL